MKTKHYPLSGFPERLNVVMTQEMSDPEWSRFLGVNRKSVLAWRHGDTNPDSTMLGKICMRLNVSADWLLFGGAP